MIHRIREVLSDLHVVKLQTAKGAERRRARDRSGQVDQDDAEWLNHGA